jgi:hypothetical protein
MTADPPGLRVETSAGERLTIGPNGTLARSAPVFTRTPSPSGKTHYHVEARTMDEARQILMDLKRKHPEIDVDATLAEAQMVETYPQGARENCEKGGGSGVFAVGAPKGLREFAEPEPVESAWIPSSFQIFDDPLEGPLRKPSKLIIEADA